MARGVIYLMTTAVNGLVKIGKTNTSQYENRMRFLESNGYWNVSGLKRRFAIEVDGFDDKETLLHTIFSKSRVGNSELFALEPDLVEQLMSSFKGKQIYPEPTQESQEQVFENATENLKSSCIPLGTYVVTKRKIETAWMEKTNEGFVVRAGSVIENTTRNKKYPPAEKLRCQANIINGKLKSDFICSSPSAAAQLVKGYSVDGWKLWKNREEKPLSIYREENNTDNEDE